MRTNLQRSSRLLLIIFWVTFCPLAAAQLTIDEKLQRVVDTFSLKTCRARNKTLTGEIGRILFESKDLSGDYDTSCSDCHLKEHGLADGLPLAVGVGGHGTGTERLSSGGTIVPRNALSLHGRNSENFNSFFWDGKVETGGDVIFSPFGEEISDRFNSALAVAAVLPLTERDEFLGKWNLWGTNELRAQSEYKYYQDKYEAISESLRSRLQKLESFEDLTERLNLTTGEDLELADISNAIAAFIDEEFGCFDSDWNRYLSGQNDALTEEAKHGAVLFFGKARCAGCHQPPAFSDFNYYSLGVPQGAFGPHTRTRDLGRAGVTNKADDLYAFRTPPLIAVSQTSPYGHNGTFPDIRSAILYHINPISFFQKLPIENFSKEYFQIGQLLATRSPRLKYVTIESEAELSAIIRFLDAL